MPGIMRVVLLLLAVVVSDPMGGGTTFAASDIRAGSRAAAPLPVFGPILPKLARSRIPVYLPSWLPIHQRLYPSVSFSNHGRSFEVDLSYVPHGGSATAALAFWLVGNLNPIRITGATQRVRLVTGRTAYIDPNTGYTEGMSIAWRQNGFVYMIGKTGSKRDLIRTANSVVRVH